MTAAAVTASVPQRHWLPPAHDRPARGEPMSSKVERAAAPHRRLLDALRQPSGQRQLALVAPLVGSDDPDRQRRLVAGVVALRASLAGEPVDAGAALAWFLGEPTAADPTPDLGWTEVPDEQLTALLPYVLDPFGETTRRAVIAGRGSSDERTLRKGLGTFYTPGDVARALVAAVVGPDCRSVLDPAVGAGVFLRAAFSALAEHMPPTEAVRCLHGVDVDRAAVDACALVLTHDWLAREPLAEGEAPALRFAEVQSRIVCGDALRLLGPRPSLEDSALPPGAAPPTTAPAGFAAPDGSPPDGWPTEVGAVLVNPPFARAGASGAALTAGYRSLEAAKSPHGVNLAWPFWELAARMAGGDGRVGIVLPLSIAYRDDAVARAARGAVLARGHWELRFFDRAPDALFGDDVKQRVALAIRRPGDPGTLLTSRLRRWSSEGRAAALGDGAETVATTAGAGVVAKIGSPVEVAAIDRLRGLGATLGDGLPAARLSAPDDLDAAAASSVVVAPTAYNWIGAFRDPAVARDGRRLAAGKLVELQAESQVMADALYGLLASRLFLWWWRATGDLFHVTLGTVTGAPFPLHSCDRDAVERLAAAGRSCWSEALSMPVTSTNRGVETVAYAPAANSRALADADAAAAAAFALPTRFVRLVQEDAQRLQLAGRSP